VSVATIVLIVIILVMILVAAAYLISLARSLMRVAANLSAVNAEIKEIPRKTEPLNPILDSLSKDLREAQGALEGVLAKPRR
jgi:cell division protein FtsL